MTKRRTVIAALAALAVTRRIKAAELTWQEMLSDAVSLKNPVTLGVRLPPPDSDLWEDAQAQLDEAVKKKAPFEIARYFVDSLPAKFQTAWPQPNPANPTLANPLIVLFFLSTHTVPVGDTTAWYAAFMNWCLGHSDPLVKGTSSASSQSFLGWGRPVWNKGDAWPPVKAKAGDVAVFTHKTDPAHGHVSFYSAPTLRQPKHVDVMGGNQFNSKQLHTFNVKSLNIESELELKTIRTAMLS